MDTSKDVNWRLIYIPDIRHQFHLNLVFGVANLHVPTASTTPKNPSGGFEMPEVTRTQDIVSVVKKLEIRLTLLLREYTSACALQHLEVA